MIATLFKLSNSPSIFLYTYFITPVNTGVVSAIDSHLQVVYISAGGRRLCHYARYFELFLVVPVAEKSRRMHPVIKRYVANYINTVHQKVPVCTIDGMARSLTQHGDWILCSWP